MNTLKPGLPVLVRMPNKKKIIHLIKSLDNGGCENFLLRTLPRIRSCDHIIITLNKKGELAEYFEKNHIKVININQNNLMDIGSYKKLHNTLNRIKPNLIVTYLFHADFVGRLFIQHATNVEVVPFLRTTYNHPLFWQARLFEKFSKGLVKHYFANSMAVKKFYENKIGVNPKIITVIPNGIDTSKYMDKQVNQHTKEEIGIKNGDFVIICVANLHKNKGHRYLLEAFEKLNKSNSKLILVGEGKEKESLQKQINEYHSKDRIVFLGRRNDIPELLKLSDIFVLPTLFEGMSNAILEAMASGIPVITTNIPENRQLLGLSGDLVSPSSGDCLYKRIRYYFYHPEKRKQKGRILQEIVKGQYDINKTAKLFEKHLFLCSK